MSTYTFDSITYTYSGSTASVTTFTGTTTATILSSFDVSSVTYSVTSIGASVFLNKTALTSVSIPSSVTSIGLQAFKNCTALASVTIPDSVTTIGTNAFQGCTNLTSVTLPTNESFTTLSNSTFVSCSNLASIVIPNSVATIGTNAFDSCSLLVSVTLPTNASFTTLQNSTFNGCFALASITIPSSVTTLGNQAFENCGSLTSITIPSSVTSIGIKTFQGCSGLTSVVVPNSVTTIGETAFRSCGSLASVTLPTNALFTTIGITTFQSCSALTSITIPSSVTLINSSAFLNCTNLASIVIPNSVTATGSSVFQGCSLLASVTLPTNASFTTIQTTTFQYCTSLASITIPSYVTTIGNYAFDNCGLTSVTIPSAVTSIGNSSFENCSSLTKVYFLQTPLLPTLGTTPFSRNPPTSVGYYYSSVTNSSTIAPFFTSLSTITSPTLTSMTRFNSTSSFVVVVISYADLVTNGNEVVENNPFVFLVTSVSSGSLSIGTTQETATLWDASTNKTIAAGANAYWTPVWNSAGLWDAFSVVVQDSIGEVSSPSVEVDINGPYACFLEGTKILCFENNEEVYRPVESLQKGDLVKTTYNGYMPVCIMGTTKLYNPGNDYRVANRLYKCSREKYPTLFEDLYITGCHCILVPSMSDEEWEITKAVNGDVFVTDNHFRLVACADENAEPFNKEGFMNIYHIALEHPDIFMNYGIYANGLLVESCSEANLRELSNMRILGEEDCSLYQDIDNVSNNMKYQLVCTC